MEITVRSMHITTIKLRVEILWVVLIKRETSSIHIVNLTMCSLALKNERRQEAKAFMYFLHINDKLKFDLSIRDSARSQT